MYQYKFYLALKIKRKREKRKAKKDYLESFLDDLKDHLFNQRFLCITFVVVPTY